jgi:hypothetical protein
MSSATERFRNKLAAVTGWERRKRREQICAVAVCASLGLSLFVLPLHVLLPLAWLRWLVPVVLFSVFAPWFFYRRRWQRGDNARAAVLLDQTLALDERAVTAWELAERADSSPAAQLVFKQADERLRAVEPRNLFPRGWSWPPSLAATLFVVWFALLWFEFDRWDFSAEGPASRRTLAQQAREYARELQEKARDQGLRESLKMGQELDKVARAGIDSKTGDESFKRELAGISKKFEDAASAAGDKDSSAAMETQGSLRDLRAELAAARDLTELPDLPKGAEEFGRQWMERLAALPQLKRQLDKADRAGQSPGRTELKAFLDKLDQQAAGELDRRALLDAQEYLQEMMKKGQARQGEQLAHGNRPGEGDPTAEGAKEKNHNNLPGKEPGKRTEESGSLPEFRADATTRVKGALGEGESRSMVFKGKPEPGKSTVSQAAVVASYRRQAEQELNSERVPEALKETIKNYFLSLGEGNR